ncbi:MAG: hypothetical protein EKK31_16815 [Hyphomicrobiales bacterium]|nr:MAG: hypothetical protein EKK31_16815 [Hyphomicrobiales bacterium]
MDRFVARANIAHFENLLARETDPERRWVIEDLLSRERQRLEIAEQLDTAEKSIATTKTDSSSA